MRKITKDELRETMKDKVKDYELAKKSSSLYTKQTHEEGKFFLKQTAKLI